MRDVVGACERKSQTGWITSITFTLVEVYHGMYVCICIAFKAIALQHFSRTEIQSHLSKTYNYYIIEIDTLKSSLSMSSDIITSHARQVRDCLKI